MWTCKTEGYGYMVVARGEMGLCLSLSELKRGFVCWWWHDRSVSSVFWKSSGVSVTLDWHDYQNNKSSVSRGLRMTSLCGIKWAVLLCMFSAIGLYDCYLKVVCVIWLAPWLIKTSLMYLLISVQTRALLCSLCVSKGVGGLPVTHRL